MRTKLLLLAALTVLPISLVGCSSEENVVGTGERTPPPDVAEQLKKRDEAYKQQMEKMRQNPTPGN